MVFQSFITVLFLVFVFFPLWKCLFVEQQPQIFTHKQKTFDLHTPSKNQTMYHLLSTENHIDEEVSCILNVKSWFGNQYENFKGKASFSGF